MTEHFSHDEKQRAIQLANEDRNRDYTMTEAVLYFICFVLAVAIIWP